MESYATEIVIRGINCRWVTCFWSILLNFMIKWWLVTCTTLVETTSVFGVPYPLIVLYIEKFSIPRASGFHIYLMSLR